MEISNNIKVMYYTVQPSELWENQTILVRKLYQLDKYVIKKTYILIVSRQTANVFTFIMK